MLDLKLIATEIEINSSCNRACSYCPNSITKRDEIGNMEPNIFHRIITELAKHQFKGRVSYHFYGEPLLSRYLSEYIIYVKKKLPNAKIALEAHHCGAVGKFQLGGSRSFPGFFRNFN